MRHLRLLFLPLLAGLAAGALQLTPPAAAGTDQQQRLSPCNGVITSTISASTLAACGEAEVTVDFVSECPVCPGGVNVVFIQLDQAPQFGWQNSESLRILLEVERYVENSGVKNVNLGVVHYDGAGARAAQRLTDDFHRVRSVLNQPGTGYIARGAAEDGANEAVRLLRQARQGSTSARERCEIIVMFAHVKSHDTHAEVLRRAGQTLRREGGLFLVGCPIDPGAWYCNGPEPDMPPNLRQFAAYPESGKLPNVAVGSIRNWRGEASVKEVSLTQELPLGLAFVEGSASVEPAEILPHENGTTVRWQWADSTAPDAQHLTYRVSGAQMGTWSIPGTMTIIDNVRLGRPIIIDPVPEITVDIDECPDEPTPTTTPRPPTATPSATATEAPTLTPTPSVFTVYLPMAVRQECQLRQRHADVALVIDVSTSMRHETRAGRPKFDAVQEAALAFVGSMRLEPDIDGFYDQVAIVGFNREAWIQQSLTNDTAELAVAIAGLSDNMREHTRLDLAHESGHEALHDRRRIPSSSAVMILLTDGLPNQVPYAEDGTMETTILNAADVVKADGVMLFTIGVGVTESVDPSDLINADLLSAVASRPEMFYQTPDAEDLAAIYAEVAVTIGCPKGRR